MAAFTQYWKGKTIDDQASCEGDQLRHTAGNEFVKKGVKVGDTLYVVSVKKSILHLLGRATVDRIVSQQDAKNELGENLWDAREHIISDHGSPMRFNRTVPSSIIKRLQFGNDKALKFVRPGILDDQTLRGVRRLTRQSSDLLDTLIDDQTDGAENDFPDELPPGTYPEGMPRRVTVNAYERNPIARRACIARHGTRCYVCTLDFAERYGEIGHGFIHVHHLKRIAEVGREYIIDPVKDLLPVCPNCHAMLHRREPLLTIDELKAMLR